VLSIKNVFKKFNNHRVLNNISLDIPKGSIAIFLGGSGVGKSTLLRALNSLETIDSGSITLNGSPLKDAHKNHVGMVFQNFNLFNHLTVLANITLSLTTAHNIPEKDAIELALALLKQYELLDKKNAYPSQLSGGQKQRLAIARALALKPEVLCLDEPTSALDPLLTSHVARTIEELAEQGYTIAIATHDTVLIDKLNATIYLMKDGSILEYANSQEFIKNKELYPHLNAFVSGTL